MCGILYLKRKDDKSPIRSLIKRYEEQKSRGQQGYGFVAIGSKNEVLGYRRSMHFDEIRKELEDFHDAKAILFHHRTPTSTPNVPEAAHPIFVSNNMLKYDYYVVHNGVIRNPKDIRDKHEALGFEYNTVVEEVEYYKVKSKGKGRSKKYEEKVIEKFNDSEALAIELALVNEGIIPRVRAYGSIAFIFIAVDKKTNTIVEMSYGRNSGNPLKLVSTNELITISSESQSKEAQDVTAGKMVKTTFVDNTEIETDFTGSTYDNTYYNNYTSSAINGYSGYHNRNEKFCNFHDELETLGDPDSCFTKWGEHKSNIKSLYTWCGFCAVYHSRDSKCKLTIHKVDNNDNTICEYCKNKATITHDNTRICSECYDDLTSDSIRESNYTLLEYKPIKPEKNMCPTCLSEFKDINKDECDKCSNVRILSNYDKSQQEIETEYEDYLKSLSEEELKEKESIEYVTDKNGTLVPSLSSVQDRLSDIEEMLIDEEVVYNEAFKHYESLEYWIAIRKDKDIKIPEQTKVAIERWFGTALKKHVNLKEGCNDKYLLTLINSFVKESETLVKTYKAQLKVLERLEEDLINN